MTPTRLLTLVLLGLLVAGCSDAAAPVVTSAATWPVTITDLSTFLAQLRCIDGSFPWINQAVAALPQKASDLMLWRRHDWPIPVGYTMQDSVVADDGQSWISPWTMSTVSRPLNVLLGDGGEIYKHDGVTVRIVETQDGGTPHIQYLNGYGTGGTGWIAFDNTAPTGKWKEVIAELTDEATPIRQNGLVPAYTRFRLETVDFPFIVFGQPRTVTLKAIVAEHYNGTDIASSVAMERTFWAEGYGRLIWEAWNKAGSVVDPIYLPGQGTVWSVAPDASGWLMHFARYYTNVVSDNANMSVDGLGWPPSGA